MDKLYEEILGCTVMETFRRSILEIAGDLQFWAGQPVGFKIAAHALSSIFSEEDSDAILFVDADNAFNRINWNVMLLINRIISPITATYVINSYNREARLFISGGEEISLRYYTKRSNCYAYLCAGISSAIKYNNNR